MPSGCTSKLREALFPGSSGEVSVAVVDGSTVRYANFGADENAQFEIGSITKAFTGLLLADAIERGEVTADTKVGALLMLGGAHCRRARSQLCATVSLSTSSAS